MRDIHGFILFRFILYKTMNKIKNNFTIYRLTIVDFTIIVIESNTNTFDNMKYNLI